jgi:hypothetical protein
MGVGMSWLIFQCSRDVVYIYMDKYNDFYGVDVGKEKLDV